MDSIVFRNTIHDMLSIIQTSLLTLSYKLEDVINSVLFAKSDTLHPSIITPKELYYELKENVNHLPKYLSFPIDLDLTYIHSLIEVSEIVSYVVDKNSIFTLKVPLVDMTMYNLYRNIPVPVPHNVNVSNSYSLIIPTYKYLV